MSNGLDVSLISSVSNIHIITGSQQLQHSEQEEKSKEKDGDRAPDTKVTAVCEQLFKMFNLSDDRMTNMSGEVEQKSKDESVVVNADNLESTLKSLEPKQLNEVLKTVSQKSIRENIPELIDKCLELLSSEKLQEAVKHSGNEHIDVKEHIEYLAWCQEEINKGKIYHPEFSTIKRCWLAVLNFIHTLLDTILQAFSFFEIGRAPAGSWEAAHMLEVYGKLIAAPFLLLALLSTLMPTVSSALLATAIIVVVVTAILLIYTKWLQPCPEYIQDATNLTAEVRNGGLGPYVLGRDDEIDEIMSNLAASNSETRLHPLLKGRSRVGKTTLAAELARRILIGDSRVPECLRGKKVFMINSSVLTDSNKLTRFIERTLQHKDKAIFFFDEIDKVMTRMVADRVGARFNSLLDASPSGLPYCIGATTTKAYKAHLKNTDLGRRFEDIHIHQLNVDIILDILEQMATRIAPDLNISRAVLKTIVDSAKKIPYTIHMNVAKKVLSKAIGKIRLDFQNREIEKKNRKIENDKKNISTSSFRSMDPISTDKLGIKTWKLLKTGEIGLSEANDKDKGDIEKVKKLVLKRADIRSSRFGKAFEITRLKVDDPSLDKLKKQFMFSNYYVHSALDVEIKEQYKKLQLPEMTSEYVEEIIKEFMPKKDEEECESDVKVERKEQSDKVKRDIGFSEDHGLELDDEDRHNKNNSSSSYGLEGGLSFVF